MFLKTGEKLRRSRVRVVYYQNLVDLAGKALQKSIEELCFWLIEHQDGGNSGRIFLIFFSRIAG